MKGAPSGTTPSGSGKSSGGKIAAIICGAIVIIVAIVAIVFVVLGSQETPQQAPEPAPVEASSAAEEAAEVNESRELEKDLIGYWEGIDDESKSHLTEEFTADGICIIGYDGQANADGGKYWVEGDVLYIQGHLFEEPYDYRVEMSADKKSMVQTNIETGWTLHLYRANKPASSSSAAQQAPEAAPAPAPAPAQTQSPYQQIAGLWKGSLQDGFPILYRFGADQHFYIGEEASEWFDDGPYTISGDTLTLNGMNGTDVYTYSLSDDGNTLTLAYPGAAYFYFTRIG